MIEIHKWKELSKLLKRTKTEEMDLRKEICAELVSDKPMEKGRVTVKDTIDGLNVKAVQTLSYNIDTAVLRTIWAELSEIEKECIKTKPVLAEGPYKKLPTDSLLHEAITSKLAAPTLEAEAPE